MTFDMANLNKYESFILQNLQNKGIKVSSVLCKLLVDSFQVTDSYARKILERTSKKEIIKSSSPLTFGKGQFAYCNINTNFTKDRIKLISKKHRPTLYRLLVALDLNDGILSHYEALKITASPLINGISKVDYLDDLIALLFKFEIVYQKLDKNLVKYIILKRKQEDEASLMQVHFAKMSTDTIFIRDILDWLIKSNIIVKNIVYRNKNNPSKGAKHNNLVWDAFAYTKTTGINPSLASKSNTPEKQTLVVLDILINRDYEQIDLDGFLKRIQINLNSVSKGKRKVLPIIIYKNCSPLILNKIKMLGFLCYDIGAIYGARIFSVLENISNLQINQKFLNQDDLEKTIIDTLSTIDDSGQNDQLKAIKGTLFEMLLYQVLKQQYPIAEIIDGKTYSQAIINKTTGVTVTENYEYDYIIKSSKPKEIIIIELKGYKSTYKIPLGDYQTKNTVKWFFNRTLTFAKKNFQKEINEGYIFKACFITSSDFTEEAITYLETLKQGGLNPKRLDVYFNRKKLFEFLKDNDYQKIQNIIDKFY